MALSPEGRPPDAPHVGLGHGTGSIEQRSLAAIKGRRGVDRGWIDRPVFIPLFALIDFEAAAVDFGGGN